MKPGMTVEEHRKYGARLAKIQEELNRLLVVYGGKYPLRKVQEGKWRRALDVLGDLRSRMDSIACEEHFGTIGDGFKTLYYPRAKESGE